jgi:hypothetical protein
VSAPIHGAVHAGLPRAIRVLFNQINRLESFDKLNRVRFNLPAAWMTFWSFHFAGNQRHQ